MRTTHAEFTPDTAGAENDGLNADTPDRHSGRGESLKSIQYIAPQMIAYGVFVGLVFGAAMTLITWRPQKVLRPLRSAPATTVTLVQSS